MNELENLDADVLRAQLSARKVMKREAIWFLVALAAGTVACLLVARTRPVALLAYFAFVVVLRTAMVRYQWWFLKRFNLTCPFCRKSLATTPSYFKSPSHDCPHCGRRALAPIKQLQEFERAGG